MCVKLPAKRFLQKFCHSLQTEPHFALCLLLECLEVYTVLCAEGRQKLLFNYMKINIVAAKFLVVADSPVSYLKTNPGLKMLYIIGRLEKRYVTGAGTQVKHKYILRSLHIESCIKLLMTGHVDECCNRFVKEI